MSVICLFVVDMLSPEVVGKSGAKPILAAETVQEVASLKDATATMKLHKFHSLFIWFPDLVLPFWKISSHFLRSLNFFII